MGLLIKEEEKRFPKEQGILAIESSEETDEEDDVQLEEPPQRIARGPVQVDVVREQSNRRLAKRRRIIADSGEGRRLESRMAETQITGIRSLKTQARPKKKANSERVVSNSLVSSVVKTDPVASTTKRRGSGIQIEEEVPSAVQTKVPMEVTVEPSKERKETVSPSPPLSEETRSMENHSQSR